MKAIKIKAYKATNKDMQCRGFQFELKTEYKHTGKISLCEAGFHACLKPNDVFTYYNFSKDTRFFEVWLYGEVKHGEDKSVASEIQFIKEVSWQEVLELVNTGKKNTGHSNSGDRNSGDRNSGDSNSGDRNSGDRNSGDRNSGDSNSGYSNSGDSNSGYSNSGDRNSGDSNSGYSNSGDRNSGDRNSGYRNSGDRNSGDRNSGDRNSGDSNSGDRNSGYRNSGDSNSGDRNSGYGNSCNRSSGIFCSKAPIITSFNLPTDKTFEEINHPYLGCYELNEWLVSDDMSDIDKLNHPNWEVLGGFLKSFTYKEMWVNGWAKDTDSNKMLFFNLPNFSADIFEEITGIDCKADYERLMTGK